LAVSESGQREGNRDGMHDQRISGGGWLKRALFAQESGLVIVIVLAMVALTFFGGTKYKRELVRVPAGTAVTSTDGVIAVGVGAAVTKYAEADGWELRESGASRTLTRRAEVNKFLDVENLILLAKDASFIAIMAVGMTAIIVMGGIDLSVGSIYALAALLGAMTLRAMQAHSMESGSSVSGLSAVLVGLLVCGGVGAACGAANGAMIVGLKVHPFIITLGMMAVLRGVVFVTTKGEAVLGVPPSFQDGFFKSQIGGVYPVPVIVMLIVMAAGWVVLTRTTLGLRIYAIGGNEIAAKYAGVPVGGVKFAVYTITGLLVGVSACVSVGYFGSASPDAGRGYELDVIAASVIGGASLSGGRGTALGAVLGAILIQLIRNAMIILEIDTNYTDIVMGAAIVTAVVLDQAKSRLVPTGK